MHLRIEPRRAALQKRLFCEIFSRTGYFVLKFMIKVNFVKIVSHFFCLPPLRSPREKPQSPPPGQGGGGGGGGGAAILSKVLLCTRCVLLRE
jgi:hypothetical protein